MVTLLDRAFLTTLDSRHLSNGLAEILKLALVKDRRLLERDGERLIDDRFLDDGPVAEKVLSRAIHGMLDELHGNLWEERVERCVDFGHTFSPSVEMQALPALLHGEAVAIDMALSTALSVRRGLVSEHDVSRRTAMRPPSHTES
jgi:3-dehydroquinate synthetase